MSTMGTRCYGQFCGVARALELVGERWALLIVRDLIGGPKRFTNLRHGLPRIATNVLSNRLKELERGGVIARRLSPEPGGPVLYELTDYGRELEDVVAGLGRWGEKSLGEPRPGDTLSAYSLAPWLRGHFGAERARGVRATYELRVGGDVLVGIRVDDGRLDIDQGLPQTPDLSIETDVGTLGGLIAGDLSASQAIAKKAVRLSGDRRLFTRFVRAFSSTRSEPPVKAAS